MKKEKFEPDSHTIRATVKLSEDITNLITKYLESFRNTDISPATVITASQHALGIMFVNFILACADTLELEDEERDTFIDLIKANVNYIFDASKTVKDMPNKDVVDSFNRIFYREE